jgi:hypothetical protein
MDENRHVDADLVEYLIVTVPRVEALRTVTPAIAELVLSGQLRVLDLVCVAPTPESGGQLVPLELDEVASIAALRYLEGESGGLLSEGDVQIAALTLPPGSANLLLLVEDLRLRPLAAAARACGGRILGGERTPRSRAQAALTFGSQDPSGSPVTDLDDQVG